MNGLKLCKAEKKNIFSDFKSSAVVLTAVFALLLLGLFLFYDQSAYYSENYSYLSDCLPFAVITISSVAAYFLYKRERLNESHILLLLLACGFALRLGYTLKYPWYANQHDVETLNSSGHLSYIWYIATNNSLPDTNGWQFSHPPLHHILAAGAVKLSAALGFSNDRCFENIQLLTTLYSAICSLSGVLLLKELQIKGKALLVCTALLIFHPSLIILSGSINNDILMITLSMLAVLCLVRWCRYHSAGKAALCGVFSGLAMMTKVSAALIAAVAALTVITVFFTDRSLRFGRFALHTLCFLVCFLPLGFVHPLRNYILFGQPLGYVAGLSTASRLYTGDINIIKRLVLPFSGKIDGVYVDVWNEYNLWGYLSRNALFGEYNFGKDGIALIAVAANAVMALLSAAVTVILPFCGSSSAAKKPYLAIYCLFAVQLLFFIYFNIKYPFGCTMDFRYVVPLLFCKVALLGSFESFAENGAFKRCYRYAFYISAAVLSASSVILMI